MRYAVALLVVAALTLAFATGCSKDKKPDTSGSTSVMDIAPPSPPPAPVAPPIQPTDTTVTTTTPPVTSPVPVEPAPSGGKTYTVVRGDTLFGIAKAHYGDGKQWTKIQAANPGLTPQNLKAGQKIIIP